MAEPLDELYFKWLYSHVGVVGRMPRAKSHWNVLRMMYMKQFAHFIPNDDNRAEDGRELRFEFFEQQRICPSNEQWESLPCDMFELLLGLSRRIAFETDGIAREWFWQLMRNLDLEQYNDAVTLPEERVHDILDRVIWRTYDSNGNGGLFPLRNPVEDQRKVELWYQLSSFLLERE